MADYVSKYTGETIEKLLASVGQYVTTDVTVDSIAFRQIVWELDPANQTDLYGIAVHPSNGKLYRIHKSGSTYTAEVYSPSGLSAKVAENSKKLVFTSGS